MKNLKSLFKINVFYGIFLFRRIILLVVLAITSKLLEPLVTSLYGKNLDISFISIITGMVTLAGALQFLVRKLSIKHISLCLIIEEIIVLACLLIYMLGIANDMFLVYVLATKSIIEAIMASAYSINISDMISKLYPKENKEFTYIKSSLLCLGGVSGAGITGLAYYFGGINLIILIAMIALPFSITLAYLQLKELVQMEKEVNAMFDKK